MFKLVNSRYRGFLFQMETVSGPMLMQHACAHVFSYYVPMLCASGCCCNEAFAIEPRLSLWSGAQAGLEDWEIARIRVNMMVQPDMRVRLPKALVIHNAACKA